MGWRENRHIKGWKQQLVWLQPECVQRLNRWKESSGKSFQAIINEIITNYERPVQSEQTQLESLVVSQMERLIEQKLVEMQQTMQNREEPVKMESKAGAETIQLAFPESLRHEDKAEILKLITDLREKEGKSFQDIAEYLSSQGIKTVWNKS